MGINHLFRFFTPEKKKDIVLIMCPGWGVTQPPIGIGYLKSFLEQVRIKTQCLDLNLDLYRSFSEKKYWELNYPEHFMRLETFKRDILPGLQPFLDPWAKRIISYQPSIVGFSLFMSNVNAAILLAKKLKEINPRLVIVAGGPEVSRLKRITVDKGQRIAEVNQEIFKNFDLLIEGEGEYALQDLMRRVNEGKDIHDLAGAFCQKGENVIMNKPRLPIKDLDALPPPDFSDFFFTKYNQATLPLITSRGCINRCAFCADSPLWKNYRQQSAKKTFQEICFLVRKYGFKDFEIVDSIFNADIGRLEAICDLINENGIKIRWSAKAAIRKEMTPVLLAKMKKAGCTDLAYGIESGSPRVLSDMKKNLDLSTAREVIRNTHEAGIRANCFFLIGFPTETEDDFVLTLDFIRENAAHIWRFDQITGCHIEEASYLGGHLEEYGVVLKPDGWYSRYSTPDVRRKRLNRFRDFARQIHSHYQCEVQE